MAALRHVAFACWELLMLGVPYRFKEIPESVADLMLVGAVLGLVIWAVYEISRWKGFTWFRTREDRPIPVAQALDAIIAHFNPSWGQELYPGTHVTMAADRFREAAQDGKIEVRGRREINRHSPIGERFSKIWSPIPASFWESHELDLAVVLDRSAHFQACETEPEGPHANLATPPGYAALRVGQRAVKDVWPSPKGAMMTGPVLLMVLGVLIFTTGGIWQTYRSLTAEPSGPVSKPNPPEVIAEPEPIPDPEPTPDQVGRQFANRSVDDLLGLFEGRTFLQGSKLFEPYKGLWLKTSGKLILALDDNQYGFLISMWVNDHIVDCRFDRAWGDALMRYNENEIVSVIGRIAQNQDPQKIKLENCELVEPAQEPNPTRATGDGPRGGEGGKGGGESGGPGSKGGGA